MIEEDKQFNPDMLRVARESRGLTQADVADFSGISQGMISKLENRLVDPSQNVLKALAEALRYPLSFFYQHEDVFGLPPTFYRRRQSVTVKTLNRLSAEMTLVRLHLLTLLRSLELDAPLSLPDLDVDEYGSPEEVARVLRATWMVPSGPIPNLISLLERAGIILVPLRTENRKIDAIGWQVPDLPPLMFYNTKAPADRLRFTLSHELGHLAMHRVPSDEMEEEANRFAAEFLAPAADLRPQLPPVSLERLARLKMVWRMSMAALLYRAHALGLISKRKYQYLWTEFGRRGWRTREPASTQLSPEEPTILTDVFRTHFEDLDYSLSDLEHALKTSADDLLRLYPISEKTLRVVK